MPTVSKILLQVIAQYGWTIMKYIMAIIFGLFLGYMLTVAQCIYVD